MNYVDVYQLRTPIASGAESENASEFVQYVKRPKFTHGNRLARDGNGNVFYEEVLSTTSEPNIDFLHSKGINTNSHPDYWFNIFMKIHSKIQAQHPDEVTIADLT